MLSTDPPDATFNNVAHAQLSSDMFDIGGAIAELKGRMAGYDDELSKP